MAAAYLVVAGVANWAASEFVIASHTYVWFAPSGVMFTALVLAGWRWAPVAFAGRILGYFIMNGTGGVHAWRVVSGALLVTAIYTLGAEVVRWAFMVRLVKTVTARVTLLVGTGIAVSVVSAFGSALLMEIHPTAAGFAAMMWDYAVGNASGILTVAPAAVLLVSNDRPRLGQTSLPGAIETLVGSGLAAYLSWWEPQSNARYFYLILIVVVLVALRRGFVAAAMAVGASSVAMALGAHSAHLGPNALRSLSAFVVASGAVALLIGAREVDRRRAASQYQQIVASAGDAFVSLDGSGLVTDWNSAAERILGWTADEVKGRSLAYLILPEDERAALRDGLTSLVGSDRRDLGFRLETVAHRRDGATFDAELSMWGSGDDRHRQYNGFIRDISDRVAAQKAAADLSAARDLHRVATDSAPIGQAVLSPAGDWLSVNPALCHLLGYTEEQLMGMPISGLLSPGEEAIEGDHADIQRLYAGEISSYSTTRRYRRLDGASLWCQLRVAVSRNAEGEVSYVVVQIEDQTERHYSEQTLRDLATDLTRTHTQLEKAAARFSALVEHSTDLTVVMTAEGIVTYASPAWAAVTGWPLESAIGTDIRTLLHPDDFEQSAPLRRRLLSGSTEPVPLLCRIRHGDGTWRHVEIVTSNRLSDPNVAGVVANARDVTERTQILERMAHQATHDELTGLPNRALLLDRISQAFARAERRSTFCALLFIDIDRFKRVNDSLGHLVGDQVLRTVATRLAGIVRPGDSVARLGGDEFVVLAEGLADTTDALDLAERIRAGLAEPMTINGSQITAGASVGVALSGAGQQPEDLLQQADIALYRAKERGRNRCELYRQAMGALARHRLATEQHLRASLEDGGVLVAYQPIVDLATSATVAYEALARLRNPNGALMLPGEFISIAEESGLIAALGEAVLRAACAQQAAWSRAGSPRTVSVNLSAQQLLDPGILDLVGGVIDEHQLGVGELCLELTETTLIDTGPSARRALESLKELGVRLALDDFGTGWSSLAYLRRFPLDVIKIDRSFVAGLGAADEDDIQVVRAIISLGHSLNIRVIAEGVETDVQERMLIDLGCDAAQGYRYGRPAIPHPSAVHEPRLIESRQLVV
ncbi:MAG TPA: EAL domain-containing protein [Acidimicrobiales bacterium]|nr:EAL domain-containing protein [Acidimicrobiales bacterium]